MTATDSWRQRANGAAVSDVIRIPESPGGGLGEIPESAQRLNQGKNSFSRVTCGMLKEEDTTWIMVTPLSVINVK